MEILIYVSNYNGTTSSIQDDLNDISRAAKTRNKKLGITGVLFYHNLKFIQILEGEATSLSELLKVLGTDKRHSGLEITLKKQIEKKSFEKWNMDSFNLDLNDSIKNDEVKLIIEACQQNFKIVGDQLVSVFKRLLKNHKILE